MTDRGVSTVLEYVFGIAIATILLGLLVTSTAGMLEDRQESAIRSELNVVGQHLAADLASADRLAGTNATTIELESTMPDTVAGAGYDITVNATAGGSELVLESGDPNVRVTVPFANDTAVESGTVDGGDVEIVLAADGDLEVRPA